LPKIFVRSFENVAPDAIPVTKTQAQIDWAWFNVCTNIIQVIRPTVFTGLMTKRTVSKHWRRVV